MVPDGDPPQKLVARRLEPHPKPILFLPAVVKLFDDTETVVALQDNTAHDMHIGTTEGRKRAAKMLDQFVEGMQIRDLALRLAVEITNQSVIEYGFIHVGPSRATSDALMEQYGISEAIYGFAFQVPEGRPIGGQAQRLIPAKGRLEVAKGSIREVGSLGHEPARRLPGTSLAGRVSESTSACSQSPVTPSGSPGSPACVHKT